MSIFSIQRIEVNRNTAREKTIRKSNCSLSAQSLLSLLVMVAVVTPSHSASLKISEARTPKLSQVIVVKKGDKDGGESNANQCDGKPGQDGGNCGNGTKGDSNGNGNNNNCSGGNGEAGQNGGDGGNCGNNNGSG